MRTRSGETDADSKRRILEEFTRRAEAFATAPALTNAQTLGLLVEASGAGSDDDVLDVACGAGLVVGAFARVTRHATGIDLTPAMIERAEAHGRALGLTNVSWRLGDVLPLPFNDASFSIVTSRYAFHHFPNPAAVLAEMVRVCRPGGRIVLADMCASSDSVRAAALNAMERLRDPSHQRALSASELTDLLEGQQLRLVKTDLYGLDWDLELVLEHSSPERPEDKEEIRRRFASDLETQSMGMNVRRQDHQIWFTYPILVLVAEKSGN